METFWEKLLQLYKSSLILSSLFIILGSDTTFYKEKRKIRIFE